VDILVNAAGVFVWRKFLDVGAEEWHRTIDTNLSAPFFLTQEASRAMADQGRGGSIINITSIHGSIGDPHVVPHCAAKFGLVGLTKATAEALRAHHIRVNAIAPGAIEPDSASRRGETPNRKVTQADIATLVVYLASDLARTITGAVIDMYGSTHTVIRP
ncbi:MAG TPA: SDR family oxidoreductase, partial [Planctomycetota bacterium]|nr:SDR family oxidoreductase [Planctomycetota bacterium]